MRATIEAQLTAEARMELERKSLGCSQLQLSVLGFGGTGLGNMYVAMSERNAIETLSAAYAAGMRYYDTAPLYGHGLSELRTGSGLRLFADSGVIVSSKVGWRLRAAFGQPTDAGLFREITAFARYNDYSYDGTMRSFEDSLQRLGTDRIDILLIHDVDRRNQGDRYPQVFKEAMTGAYKAVLSLREQGVVRAIGCGLNEWEACQAFAEAGDFDCFLLAGRYTLLEQESLQSFLPLCETRHWHHPRRTLQLRHTRERRGQGCLVQLRARDSRCAGQSARHRSHLHGARRAAEGGSAASPAAPLLRGERHSRHRQRGAVEREPAHARQRDSACLLARPEVRRPDGHARPHTVTSAKP
jgi:aryl-alcohol dehydrogenase-like predicted oxidoreductase